ncbi:MAG: hypothetical protein HKN58_04035, partial [Xanthomonadales bacterium]|nr:hypothetical protein [Xanthomonadales bacterium]
VPEETAGDYYVEERPVRNDYATSFASSRYYPWWSVDYFYLGSSHGYRNHGWSIGFSYGSPHRYGHGWYDPFAWYYDPWGWSIHYPLRYSYWYTPFYSRFHDRYAWHHHYWRDRYYRHHGYRYGGHDRWRRGDRDRPGDGVAHRGGRGDNATLRPNQPRLRDQDPVAGRDRDSLRRRFEDGRIPRAAKGKYPRPGKQGGQSGDPDVRRHVSVAPAGSGARGMEVRKAARTKPEPTRIQPAPALRDRGAPAARAVTAQPSTRPSMQISKQRRGQALVRSPAAQKGRPERTRPTPVTRSRSERLSPVVRYEPPRSRAQPVAPVSRNKSRPVLVPRASKPQPAQRTVRPTAPAKRAYKPAPVSRSTLKAPGAVKAPAPKRVYSPPPSSRPSTASRKPSHGAAPERGKAPARPNRAAKRQKR